ncbi:MAG: hypothetical protein D6784_03540 [Chloroflexi bacterium]|nr:MAG: hypothetical protein D6784_03540 [Chloroflexota bacterium]
MLYEEASIKTASQLRNIAHSRLVSELSTLSLPEIDEIVDLVARVIPAGNVPGVILNGLLRQQGSAPPPDTARRDINLIFRGIKQTLDKAVYGAAFAGPAAVLWGYQNLLKLAGKDPAQAFPDGVWQFYVTYALREDSARHANETRGFDAALARRGIRLSRVDRCTAWLMTAIHTLHRYDVHLRNEWRERVYTHLLRQITRGTPYAARCAGLYRQWEQVRPYHRPPEVNDMDYFTCRRVAFDRFLEPVLNELPADLRQQWLEAARQAKAKDLPAYQRQMSILARLEPGPYGETIVPISLDEAQVGLIYQGHYYLFPTRVFGKMPNAAALRAQLTALMNTAPDRPAVSLIPLAQMPRAHLPALITRLDARSQQSLADLQKAVILINGDRHASHLPLARLRQTAERGIGSHPLTIIDAGESFVFDQSHIFFDGIGGAALAEIMTNEAVEWAEYLHTLPPVRPARQAPLPLVIQLDPQQLNVSPARPEADAENHTANLKAIQSLRRVLRRRNEILSLTVNDLLVLYRAIHAFTYRPSRSLQNELRTLTRAGDPLGQAAREALGMLLPQTRRSPAILIPVDASQRAPRDRLYPVSFETPLQELGLLELHQRAIQFLDAYPPDSPEYARGYRQFEKIQRRYLATLAGFGAVMKQAKEIAIAGEAASVEAVKLLAHLPVPLQRLLDSLPNQFDVLNDLIKGREVFSNIGQVAPTSTLTRFITAKDDNEKKTLAWGILTDAQGVMHISLRDFRPAVVKLVELGYDKLAAQITQEYLDAYVRGLNRYVEELYRIALAQRPAAQG